MKSQSSKALDWWWVVLFAIVVVGQVTSNEIRIMLGFGLVWLDKTLPPKSQTEKEGLCGRHLQT
jgi:hypothetical protein